MDDIYIKLPTTTVYGKLAGDASKPLVLGLHGWSQRNGWHTWESLMAPLAEAGYCVVSVDMPGWGQSPPVDALPLAGERAASVVLQIINGLQKEKAILMGKSWGGGVALETALAYPDRITHLILTAPAFRNLERLHGVRQAVLLAWAEDDEVIPVKLAKQYQKELPVVELAIYPTGGHSAAQQNVNDFTPKAVAFLSRRRVKHEAVHE